MLFLFQNFYQISKDALIFRYLPIFCYNPIMQRKIIHVDMDAYYASIEQRDNPELKGRPVIVGGKPNERSVVSACSYEARKFGIHSAMPTATAYKLCPQAVFIYPRFDAYIHVSKLIRNIFREYTDLYEPLSLDEAFLDVTENKRNMEIATDIAKEIKTKIFFRTQLTASAGVSFNKFIAKVASDFQKPDGLTVIRPEQAEAFLEKLPVRKFYGVGEVTEKKMHALGIKTGADLKKLEKNKLISLFGSSGAYFYDIARGIDDSPVVNDWDRKSIGKEITLPEDILDKDKMTAVIGELANEVAQWLKDNNTKGRTITLKVKYYDFMSITRSVTLKEATDEGWIIIRHCSELLEKTLAGKKKIRLFGVSVHNFGSNEVPAVKENEQLGLF